MAEICHMNLLLKLLKNRRKHAHVRSMRSCGSPTDCGHENIGPLRTRSPHPCLSSFHEPLRSCVAKAALSRDIGTTISSMTGSASICCLTCDVRRCVPQSNWRLHLCPGIGRLRVSCRIPWQGSARWRRRASSAPVLTGAVWEIWQRRRMQT